MNAIPTVVYIVDDDPEVRRALARLLRAASYTTRSFGSASEFLVSSEARLSAGCIILDLAMPGLNGLELQQCLAASGCHRPIVFLTGAGDISKSVLAMKAGAVNFLTKPVNDRELLAAVEEALRVDATERAAWSTRHSVSERLTTLTRRERQVFEQVVAGTRIRRSTVCSQSVPRSIAAALAAVSAVPRRCTYPIDTGLVKSG